MTTRNPPASAPNSQSSAEQRRRQSPRATRIGGAGAGSSPVARPFYDPGMSNATVGSDLPGAEIVAPGLEDLAAGRDTEQAAAVAMAARRLREAGLEVPEYTQNPPAAHRLYERLAEADRRTAHSRYNAIVRRMASFASALEHARGR